MSMLPLRHAFGTRRLWDLPRVFLGRRRPRWPWRWVGPGRSERLAVIA